jgi:hypothetical protein
MTIQQPASAFRLDAHADFALLRSDFMDEFARLEVAVGRRLRRMDPIIDTRKSCFGQNVDKLARAKPCPGLSTKSAATLATFPQDCEPFQELRASLAHGVLEIATTEDGVLAIFRNAADVIEDAEQCYAFTKAIFQLRIRELATLRKRIEALTPSLQPLPAPAGAAGP